MSLQIQQLTHTYFGEQARTVLEDVAFALAAGEQLLLRGISGSGKTTLINILAGLQTPTSGSVQINGQAVYGLAEAERDAWRRGNVGYVFQTHHLLPLLNAWENVAMPLAFAGVSKAERKETAISLLDAVGLGDHITNKPNQLSTGQRQRVAIARALVHKPALVLADEPTASLDAESAVSALDLLQETCRAQNTMLIVASHDPTLNGRFARIADLAYGKWSEQHV